METAKLFMSGNSQAVHLPQSYHFSGDEVVIKRLGNAVVLLPKENPWQVMFDAIEEFHGAGNRARSILNNGTRALQ
jgi:antitoxin VapB